MNFANRKFRNNETGELVSVLDSFDNIAILENKQKVYVDQLTNPLLYTEEGQGNAYDGKVEEVNPINFFKNQNAYNVLADKIKNIPDSLIKDDSGSGGVMINIDGNNTISTNSNLPTTDESAIVITSEEDQRAELAKKYGVVDNTNSVTKQNEEFDRLLNPDKYKVDNTIDDVTTVEAPRKFVTPGISTQEPPPRPVVVEDPIIRMFKGVKRVVDFNLTIDVANKIPRIDFIEMMEDSYETSIIDYLADEFTNNIINNPGEIREMIKKKIMSIVYEKEEVVKEEVVKKTRRKPVRRNKADGSLVIDKETKESKPKRVTKKKDETV